MPCLLLMCVLDNEIMFGAFVDSGGEDYFVFTTRIPGQ